MVAEPGTELGADQADELGTEMVLDVERVAHGGHCVARYAGRVVFVRHTLPGEQVRAVVTGVGSGGRFLRADAVQVLRSVPGRVDRPCPWSGPGRCGGCDWQHADLALQREMKAAVVREQFDRLAGLDLAQLLGREVVVEPVPGDRTGLGWRTRVEFAVDGTGRPGLRAHRSHEVVRVTDCPIAHPRVLETGVLGRSFPGAEAVDVIAPSVGEAVVVEVSGGRAAAPTVRERVPGGPDLEFALGARGFWQVHPGAAATFLMTVLDWLEPAPGERALDLYAGVGLFAAALADAVGEDGAVLAVERDRTAVGHAQHNLAGRPWVEVRRDRVDRAVRRLTRAQVRADVVVLDPPRSGAGRAVVRDVVALGPRAVAYLACDPAALARDVAYAAEVGYRIRDLRAFDAFPMTHHIECIAVLEPR
ncbi:class I SAM-dependent RNA methyltransferase [soil metagenome]